MSVLKKNDKFKNILKKKRKYFFKNRKKTEFISKKIKNVFYSDLSILKRFISVSGKIVPSKFSNVNLFFQSKLKKFIKISKFLSLNYYIFKHKI